jgi:hypothetical protein
MDIKRLITHFTYRIEQKPGGGFIAHASDVNVPPIEAPTRMELQHKIQDNINAALATEFPGLKLSESKRVSFHLERQADGALAFHSSDPNAQSAGPSTHEEVESHFAEKMFSLFGKQIIAHLPPEVASQLPPELSAQLNSGNIKVFVEKKVSILGAAPSGSAMAQALPQNPGAAGSETLIREANFASQSTSGSPITPERGNSGKFLRFLLALAVIFGMMYLYLRLHH